jgi:hypothetical protein
MTDATLEYILGLGGFLLDPGGASTLCRRVSSLGVSVPTPYPQNNLQPVYDAVKAVPSGNKLFLAGDSCGCTRIIQIAKDIYPRVVDGLYCIQSSYWCQMGSVPIGDNVKEAIIFYSSWLLTGGLGVYKPPLVVPPTLAKGESLYDGKTRVGNNGRTKVTYLYVPDLHPGDNDKTGVQDPIINHIKQSLAA